MCHTDSKVRNISYVHPKLQSLITFEAFLSSRILFLVHHFAFENMLKTCNLFSGVPICSKNWNIIMVAMVAIYLDVGWQKLLGTE